ncbi:dTMP kinase [uncultured Anaerococcus sp.]|uniref:dTMP kinase n=1 Tax=uncultured Anaerococcus sp. TaxID=293428 RepID=UPI00262334B5|nr:dTMP kinase [uncultured Anaerococcus sp.]
MNGKLIVFEGPDGSGKTSVLTEVKRRLDEDGIDYLDFREPGGTTISEKIRNLIIDNDNIKMTARCECLLFAASRAQLIEEAIRPALDEGKLVLCDRFVLSSLLYQGLGRGLGIDQVREINDFATNKMRADLTIFFDIDYKTALERKRANFSADRLENEDFDFHKKIFDGYVKMAEKYKDEVKKIDATLSIKEVTDEALKLIYESLEDMQ